MKFSTLFLEIGFHSIIAVVIFINVLLEKLHIKCGFRWTPSRGQCKDHASQHASPSPIVFNKTQKDGEEDSEEKYG